MADNRLLRICVCWAMVAVEDITLVVGFTIPLTEPLLFLLQLALYHIRASFPFSGFRMLQL